MAESYRVAGPQLRTERQNRHNAVKYFPEGGEYSANPFPLDTAELLVRANPIPLPR